MNRPDLPLGRAVEYSDTLDPTLLCAIPRTNGRKKHGLEAHALPFRGNDVWNCYELTWLTPEGIPRVAIGRITVPSESENLVESKSLKLYLMSFANSVFSSEREVQEQIAADLTRLVTTNELKVEIALPHLWAEFAGKDPSGRSLDSLNQVEAIETEKLVSPGAAPAVDRVYTHLFRSLCPVTGQPDFATIEIAYQGPKIDDRALLHYLLSFRNRASFGEDCCETIYLHMLEHASPKALSVSCHFTRRGGIDLNPARFSEGFELPAFSRSLRQ